MARFVTPDCTRIVRPSKSMSRMRLSFDRPSTIASSCGIAPPRQRCAGAPRHDFHALLVAITQDRRDLLGRARKRDREGQMAVGRQRVGLEWSALILGKRSGIREAEARQGPPRYRRDATECLDPGREIQSTWLTPDVLSPGNAALGPAQSSASAPPAASHTSVGPPGRAARLNPYVRA